MINRRLIRIKVFKVLYSSISSGEDSLQVIEKELIHSCQKTLDLYYFMLNISVALKRASDAKIEAGLKKYHPTPEEANPNRKFSDNRFTQLLLKETALSSYCEKKGLIWSDDLAIFVKKLFATISTKDYYKEYMEAGPSDLAKDCALFKTIYEEEFEDNEELASFLEDLSLYWIDDLAFILNVIIKNIELLAQNGKLIYPNVFLKDDDREYAIRLIEHTFSHYNEYLEIVTKNVSNWDSDRLVATDMALIVMGISEAVAFSSIPIKVTINEYVEISKFYSTPNSKVFVNGLLDKIIQQMLSEGKIVKTGRGLIES